MPERCSRTRAWSTVGHQSKAVAEDDEKGECVKENKPENRDKVLEQQLEQDCEKGLEEVNHRNETREQHSTLQYEQTKDTRAGT